MYWVKRVPIEKPCQPSGIENCGLTNYGAQALWFNLKLKPRAARHFHLCCQIQSTIRFKALYAPEIQSIANGQSVRISPAPPQPHAASEKIEEASNPPQETSKVPTSQTANPLDWSKRQSRWN